MIKVQSKFTLTQDKLDRVSNNSAMDYFPTEIEYIRENTTEQKPPTET